MSDHLQGEYVISKQNLDCPLHSHSLSCAGGHPVAVATPAQGLALLRPCVDTNKLAFDDKKGVES